MIAFIADIEHHIMPEPMSGCWLWTGALGQRGYGDVQNGGRHTTAHRLLFERANGPIPAGMHVLHKCDVRPCCNPDHLFLGTNRDNIIDSMKKGRRKGITRRRPSGLKYKPMSPEGRIAHMKVKPETRAQIKALVASGASQASVARQFGLGGGHVCRIVHE